MGIRRWGEMASADFGAVDARRCVAVLPLCATEQHGPHLPTGTDTLIAEGILAEAAGRAGPGIDAAVLPVIPVGNSAEHGRYPGTLSVEVGALAAMVVAIAAGVAAAGFRKLLIVSSHGGNVAAMNAAALECRVGHGLFAVATTFARLGLPEGLVAPEEAAAGVHGGLIETALMLHLRPDLVDMGKAAAFPSLQTDMARRFIYLRAHGPVGFGWLAGDLNAAGVVGDACSATAEIGAAIAALQADALLQLIAEMAEFDAEHLLNGP